MIAVSGRNIFEQRVNIIDVDCYENISRMKLKIEWLIKESVFYEISRIFGTSKEKYVCKWK